MYWVSLHSKKEELYCATRQTALNAYRIGEPLAQGTTLNNISWLTELHLSLQILPRDIEPEVGALTKAPLSDLGYR